MSKRCKGGFVDGMPVYTNEDANTCVNGGGAVISDGNGGCAAAKVAALSTLSSDGGDPEQSLGPFRRLRTLMGHHEIVRELLKLNRLAAPHIGDCAFKNSDIGARLMSAFERFSAVTHAVTDERAADAIYDRELHEELSSVARTLAESSGDREFQEATQRVIALAERYVGRSGRDIAANLGPGPQPGPPPQPARPVAIEFDANTLSSALAAYDIAGLVFRKFRPGIEITVEGAAEYAAADRAIGEKAAAMNGAAGARIGTIVKVPGGFKQRFQNSDIYFSPQTGAHEIHGDIREKYNALGGAHGVLGIPVTDETATPDGVGRFNHFINNGSIYWTPRTGPMMVRGVIRNLWQSQGWELGPMGYPIADEMRLPGLLPQDSPQIAWSLFENGALFSNAAASARALSATVTPDAVKGLIRGFVDRGLKSHSEDLGLEARVDILSVTTYRYNFWRSAPRAVTFRLYGFHDNGILPDTTFEIDMRLAFSLVWTPMFTFPAFKTLVATLEHLRVQASGLGSGQASSGIYNGVHDTFWRGGPQPDHTEVPDGSIFLADVPTGANQHGAGNLDVIDVLTTSQGGLEVMVNPLPTSIGQFRRIVAQNQIDAVVQSI